MTVTDLEGRFDVVSVTSGSLAAVTVDAVRTAARVISNRAPDGSDPGVVAVVQHLEQAAHTAARLLDGVTPLEAEQDTAPEPAYFAGGGYPNEPAETKRRQSSARTKPAKEGEEGD
jgi:hypothetical protein